LDASFFAPAPAITPSNVAGPTLWILYRGDIIATDTMLSLYVVRSPQTMEEAPVPIRSPGHHIDPDHRGPIIDILVWICFVFSSLAIVSKIILKVGKRTRYFRWSRLQVDDGAILLALVSAAHAELWYSR
jgi:hypothetical protein